ncbi:MAG: hypothetical protein D6755_08380 [Anaerolineae bacterium]|nr:MAG: hypothetical protein D6755_08380 [Anaerolineae bacterium]
MSPHINPRFRAYGKARLDIARRAHTRQDWEALWKPTMHPFAFTWGERWRHCIEYRVDDFAAEVGFFIDVLGFPVNAFNEAYAMFTSPDEAFHLAVLPADETHAATPPDALRLQFMIAHLESTVDELERRGVTFAVSPRPLRPGSPMHIAVFHTPHGIPVELWSEVHDVEQPPRPLARPQGRNSQRRELPLAAAPASQGTATPQRGALPGRGNSAPLPENRQRPAASRQFKAPASQVPPSTSRPAGQEHRWPRRVPRRMSAAGRARRAGVSEPDTAPPPPDEPPSPPRERSLSAEAPEVPRRAAQPVVPVRTRKRPPSLRSNRVQLHFLPVPSRESPSPDAEEEETMGVAPEPQYEDLPDGQYYDDEF